MAFTQIDESLDLLSVNTLRYADQGWYCATTDGFGVVHVAHHFGIDVGNEAILGIHGGGGAARSIASAWMKVGGRVASLGGKRQLPATLVNFNHQTETEFDLIIDTEGTLDELPESKFILHPNYTNMGWDVGATVRSSVASKSSNRWTLDVGCTTSRIVALFVDALLD